MTPGDEPEISILDARLAEIDRRLHSIQAGLGDDEPRGRGQRPSRPVGVPADGLRAAPPASPRDMPPPVPPPRDMTGPLAPPRDMTRPVPPLRDMPPPLPLDAPPRLPPPDAHSAAELLIRLREVTAEQEGLLDSMRQLLGTLQRVATTSAAAASSATPGPATPAGSTPVTAGSPVGLSAGPFASTAALHAFRAALEALPGVRRVELRGFEGVDRAVLEVHL